MAIALDFYTRLALKNVQTLPLALDPTVHMQVYETLTPSPIAAASLGQVRACSQFPCHAKCPV